MQDDTNKFNNLLIALYQQEHFQNIYKSHLLSQDKKLSLERLTNAAK